MACVNSTEPVPHFLRGKSCEGWLKKGGKFAIISEIMPTSRS
jgi:hypothetical protein